VWKQSVAVCCSLLQSVAVRCGWLIRVKTDGTTANGATSRLTRAAGQVGSRRVFKRNECPQPTRAGALSAEHHGGRGFGARLHSTRAAYVGRDYYARKRADPSVAGLETAAAQSADSL